MDKEKAEKMLSDIEQAYADVPYASMVIMGPVLDGLRKRLRRDKENSDRLYNDILKEFEAL